MVFAIWIFVFGLAQLWPVKVLGSVNYTVEMTAKAYSALSTVSINSISGRACVPVSGYSKRQCELYCREYYAYVPLMPLNNLQAYDPESKQCKPKVYCPPYLGVFYDRETNKCYDNINGLEVSPRAATRPDPTKVQMLNVTVICEHGKQIVFNGLPECQCQLGYKTEVKKALSQNKTIIKVCNKNTSIYDYFPEFFQIFYNENYDNRFPYALDPDYWLKAAFYYIRKFKYSIVTYFSPWQAQIITIMIPGQEMLRDGDLIWIFWLGSLLALIIGLSIYEKNVNGSTKPIQSTQNELQIEPLEEN